MKFLFLPLTLLVAGSCAAQYARDLPENIARFEQHPARALRSGGSPTRGFDLHYLRCEWDIDPAVRYISGTVTSYFNTTATVNELRFDLSDSLIVDAVIFQGQAIPFSRIPGDQLVVDLNGTLAAGVSDSVRVTYHGIPPNTGFGSFVTGTQHDVPVMWTLSEPYGASDWWPAKEDNNDKVDSLDAYVTVPEGYRSAGNGILASETTSNGHTTCHWKHRYPIDHYLIATAVTNYATETRVMPLVDDSVTYLTYAYPTDMAAALVSAGDVQELILLYSQLFGNYPFAKEKYGQTQFGWTGGMEHQTMTFLGQYMFDLSAHELAHQWFGDKVTCGSWADIWLNEGFATYLTGLGFQYLRPEHWYQWKHDVIANITEHPDGSVFCTDTNDINRLFSGRLTYNKGAMVLHMLRWVIGDSAFFQGARAYLDDPELAFGTALTADLKAHFEATSGMDLTGFFADWYTGQGYPAYTTAWSQDQVGNVTVSLSQTPTDASVDFFELPVPIRFSGGGADSTVVLDHTTNGQQFTFHLPFAATDAVFDPDLWLISGNNIIAHVDEMAPSTGMLLPYPNPAQDRLHWRVAGNGAGYTDARIVDELGRPVRQVSAASGSIDLPGLAAGIYFLELRDGRGGLLRSRFVKE